MSLKDNDNVLLQSVFVCTNLGILLLDQIHGTTRMPGCLVATRNNGVDRFQLPNRSIACNKN